MVSDPLTVADICLVTDGGAAWLADAVSSSVGRAQLTSLPSRGRWRGFSQVDNDDA
jgi:hypothetical protein